MVRKVIPLEAVESRMASLREQMEKLGSELRMLEFLAASAIEDRSPTDGPAVDKPPLTERVLNFVVLNGGRTSTQIADAMLAQFAHNGEKLGGSDPRKTLLTTIGSLVSKGRIQKDQEGGHFVR